MATTSSSSRPTHSIAASSSKLWEYDVFLSFRGEDTRKTFVDHLYTAFKLQGIHTYKDDEELPRGESIGPSLRNAIQESQIAVIVFSENYAESSWCLDELAYIMECKDKRGQTVLPIFYKVDPSEVRKQKRKFGEAFAKHESENNNKVESWRKALVDAANLAGWETKYVADGHEAKCIEQIVDEVSHRLLPSFSSVGEGLIGIEARLKDLISQLDIGACGVRMVGIWGVGGGGKTTLAYSVYGEISCKFDGCSFIENVRENSSDLKKLQEKIISDVLGKGIDVGNIGNGKRMIKSRLCRKRALIVLDDVDKRDQLEALVGSHDWFGEGSRIIITTRDEHLLNTHRVDVIHGVHLLNDHEAIQLLRRHAYREHKPVVDYGSLSQQVVSYAGGLPLALKVLGSFLYDKDKNGWTSVLARLKDIPNPTIIETLKISYDGLEPVEKELFLDIACFFRWDEIDAVMPVLDALGYHPHIGATVLIQKALITISDGKFDMHDLVQEMGHDIVRGENRNNPENHSRVWREEDVIDLSSRGIMKENYKIEAFYSTCDYEDDKRVPHFSEFVSNMKKLRFLDVSFPYAPKFLSNDLRWMAWYDYPGHSLPIDFQPTKLVALILNYSRLEQLWMGCKHLPCLKVLNLYGSEDLIKTPDFDGCPNLERLNLGYCKKLTEIHPSIGHLERLVYLNLNDCYMLESFPPIIHMKNLETFILSCCRQLRKFPEIQGNMDSLEHLDLSHTRIEVVPSSIGQYCTNLVSISLSGCNKLKSIEGNFRLLKRLEVLKLHGCDRLEKLPDDLFDIDCRLVYLSLPVGRTHGFPTSSLHLPHFLKKLVIRSRTLIEGDIPFDFGGLSNLEVLDLCSNGFSWLPFTLSQLSRLKYLNLSGCQNLVQLPKLPSSIAVIIASGCESLEAIEELPTDHKWLWKVSLARNNRQRVIGAHMLLQSMLQGNIRRSHFLSLVLPGHEIPQGLMRWLVKVRTFTLQLPHNWSNNFTGFLVFYTFKDPYIHLRHIKITLKQETAMDPQYKRSSGGFDHPVTTIGYVSFSSLRHTKWWNPSYNTTTFSLECNDQYDIEFVVSLVPREGKGDPTESSKSGIDCSTFWDEEDGKKTFTIEDDSESSVSILWYP